MAKWFSIDCKVQKHTCYNAADSHNHHDHHDHHYIKWPRGKFPPWQIHTMSGICLQLWWECVSDKISVLLIMRGWVSVKFFNLLAIFLSGGPFWFFPAFFMDQIEPPWINDCALLKKCVMQNLSLSLLSSKFWITPGDNAAGTQPEKFMMTSFLDLAAAFLMVLRVTIEDSKF